MLCVCSARAAPRRPLRPRPAAGHTTRSKVQRGVEPRPALTFLWRLPSCRDSREARLPVAAGRSRQSFSFHLFNFRNPYPTHITLLNLRASKLPFPTTLTPMVRLWRRKGAVAPLQRRMGKVGEKPRGCNGARDPPPVSSNL